jgi:hypothetical protein
MVPTANLKRKVMVKIGERKFKTHAERAVFLR